MSDKILCFIPKTIKNLKVESTARGKMLAEVHIQRSIFLGDLISPLQFVIAMMLFRYIPRIFTGGYKVTKSQETIIHLKNDKIFVKNKKKKEQEILRQIIRIYGWDMGWNLLLTNVLKGEKRNNGRN